MCHKQISQETLRILSANIDRWKRILNDIERDPAKISELVIQERKKKKERKEGSEKEKGKEMGIRKRKLRKNEREKRKIERKKRKERRRKIW